MSRSADPTTRISLLRAARAVFAEHGVASAKVEDITRAAGCSKGAFYLHFASKEDCFKMLVEGFLAQCQQLFASPPPAESPIVATVLLRALTAAEIGQFEVLWHDRAIVGMVQSSCQGEFAYLFQSFRETVYERCVMWVRYFCEQGHYRSDVNIPVAAMLLSGAYNELAMRFTTAPSKPPIAEWLGMTQQAFSRAFGTPAFIEAMDSIHREMQWTQEPKSAESLMRPTVTAQPLVSAPESQVTVVAKAAKGLQRKGKS
jgi:AcrR family transcriptional regulator